MIENHLSPAFILDRRMLLQDYFTKLLLLEGVATSRPMLSLSGMRTRDFHSDLNHL